MNAGENEYQFSKNDGPQGRTINTISYKAKQQSNSIKTKNPQSEMGTRRCVSVRLDVQIEYETINSIFDVNLHLCR